MHIVSRLFFSVFLALAGAVAATAQGDPFSANAYRVERDNLAEKNAAADTGTSGVTADGKAQSALGAVAPRHFPWRDTQAFNDGWEYLERNLATPEEAAIATGWVPVTLPHSWNAKDTIEKAEYRRDVSWYRKVLNFDSAAFKPFSDLYHYLRFGAAGQSATVYFNGTQLAAHHGGYSAFTVELPKHLRRQGDNSILVRVSNEKNRHLPPLSGDFNQYGGLYRQVHLIRANWNSFARDVLPTIKSETTAAAARFEVAPIAIAGALKTSPLKVELTVTAPDGTVVAEVQGAAGSPLIGAVANPLLWSPEAPNLYTFTFRLRATSDNAPTVVDQVTLRHGFRWFEFTPDNGFFLNGKPCKLVGVSRHQDRPGFGPALSDAQHDADLRRIKEVGFNFLRLAHYQQDDYVLQRCDELGLLIWEEIPLVNVIAPRAYPPSEILAANATSMLTDMVTQHRHHPSIIIWGLGNEISYSTQDEHAELHEFELRLIRDLNTLAHRLDPTRKTIIVSHDSDRAA
ncbi:MAG: hypothetical protein LBV54_04235, partial [Puniceicoccales bacterium]|nr:hypothetical protein [Puniceicoccales bacterium]